MYIKQDIAEVRVVGLTSTMIATRPTNIICRHLCNSHIIFISIFYK